MIYIIEGEEQTFIEEKITKIMKQEDANIVKFDGNSKDFDVLSLIDSCTGNSLFAQKTIVLVKDAPFLIRKYDDKGLQIVLEYVDNPIFETDLIFYTYENKHNSKLKAYKAISKNAQVITLDSYDFKNFNTYVNQQINLNKLDINNDAIYLLNNICKRNATLLKQNIEILKNYPDKITVEVINKLCTSSDNNDSFELINAITNKDISKTIFLERKMLNDNDSILSVIGLLASQLRFLYQLSYYISIGKSRNEIIDIAKCSDGRYNKSLETLRNLKQDIIIGLLAELSNIDIKCKSDYTIPDKERFELFILKLLEKENYASN